MKVTHSQKTKVSPLSAQFHKACLPALLMLAGLSTASLHAQSSWNMTSGSWSTDFNWTPAVVPLSDFTTQLIFEATDGYTTTNDIGSETFNLNRITVNNTGTGTVTINGASNVNTLTFGGIDPTLDITGTTLFNGLMAGSATITKTGTGTFIHDSNNGGFTGTVIINQGTFVNRSTTVATTNFNPVSIVVNDGGTYQFGAATTGNPNLPNSTYVTVNTGGTVSWQEGEDFGGFHLQGGTINLQFGGANCFGSTPQSWTSGTLTGGSFAIQGDTGIDKTTAGTVFITGNASISSRIDDSNVLNIMEGTVSMANAANLGNVNVTLGDNAGNTSGTFAYQGVTASRSGSFGVNAGNGVIHVDSATTVLTLNGPISGVGNLKKTGAGKLRLAGTLDGTGTISVDAGALQVEPVTAFGNFAVGANTVLAINSGAGATSFNVPGLSIADGTATLQFDLDTNAVTTAPLMIVSIPNGLTFSGTPTLRVTNLQGFANGTYTLLDYDGVPITSGFNLSLPGRTLGTLVYDTANTRVDVAISGTDTVKWAGGVSGDWDAGTGAGAGGTSNWRLVAGAASTNFIDTDTILFDDSATRRDVNLVTTLRPFATVVNAAGDYTFGGPGKLSGSTALNKSGAGTLTLSTDNDYIGGTTVTQGTLQLGNGGTTGSVVGTITLSGGTLAFNRFDDYAFTNTVVVDGEGSIVQNGTNLVTFPNAFPTGTSTVNFGGSGNLTMAATVSGTGTINKNDTGTLTLLANNNTFTGTLNVNGGTVLLEDLGGGGDFGAHEIAVNNGGTFIFGPSGNTDLPDTAHVTINTGGVFRIEQGENYGGFTLNGGEFRFVSSGRTGVNSTAIAATDGATVYDLRSGTITTDFTAGTGGGLNQGGNATTPLFGVLTKTTGGTVTVSGGVTFQAALAIQIREGTLAMGMNNFPSTGTTTVTMGDVLTGGTLRLNGTGTASTSRAFSLDAGGGTFNVADVGASVTLFGTVSGPGSLSKTGDGILVLSLGNDYTGNTLVAGGTLEANNFFGSATGSGPVVVSATLAGDGAIITGDGNDVLLNGIFQPGATGAQQGGDFNITTGVGGSTVFGPSSVASFDLWSTTGSDQSTNPFAADLLIVAGDFEITDGAVLKLTNPNALSFQEGDVFRLIDWTGVGAATGTWIIDSTALNLGGFALDTSDLYTSGTVGIVNVPEPTAALLTVLGLAVCVGRRRRSS